MRLDPETALYDIEALMEMDDYINSKGKSIGNTKTGFDEAGI
jgi:hypothetical protein